MFGPTRRICGDWCVTSGILLITMEVSFGSLKVRCSVKGREDADENGVDDGEGPRKPGVGDGVARDTGAGLAGPVG